MSDLEKLLDVLRSAETRQDAIELLKKKLLPKLARMKPAQLSETLAQAVFAIYCLETENDSLEEAAESIHQTSLHRRVADAVRAHHAVKDAGIKTLSDSAKKAAAAKDAKWEPVRAHAVKLATDGKYKSRRQAASSIVDEVIKFAKEKGISMTQTQAPTTICGWLKAGGYTPLSR